MTRLTRTVLVLILLAPILHGLGDEQPKSTSPPDLLKNAIDPFNEGVERAKFLRAVGTDIEMDQAEFQHSQESQDGFVRAFERWKLIAGFDRTGNGMIDWLEMQEYRRAVLAALVREFDANHDGKLAGVERERANAALREGRVPPLDRSQKVDVESIRKVTDFPVHETDLQRFRDKVDAAQRADHQVWDDQLQRNRRIIDRNHDGKIDPSERAFLISRLNEITQHLYDTDHDGKLTEVEERAWKSSERYRFLQAYEKHADDEGLLSYKAGEEMYDELWGKKEADDRKQLWNASYRLKKVADKNGDGVLDKAGMKKGS